MKTLSLKRNQWLIIVAVLLCIAGVGIAPASAQATPIAIGENSTGEVSASVPIVEFTLTVPTAQTARVLVLAITPGLAPSFTVTDPTTGVPLAIAGVDGTATTVQSDVTLAAGVAYAIQVQSASGVFGQFVLSVQAGPALAPPTALVGGQPVSGHVSVGGASEHYSFAADPAQGLLVSVISDNPAAGPQVTLGDSDLGQALAVSSPRLNNARFGIPAGTQNYVVEVGHGGSAGDEPYTVCLEVVNGAAPCPGSGTVAAPATTPEPTEPPLPTQPNFQAIQIPANGPCSVAPAGGSPINVRSGPSTSFSVVSQLAPNTIVPVVGRTADNSWYQVNISGLTGWVSATVVRIGGNNCGSITVIGAPTPVPPAATSEVTATPSPTSGATATPSPTAGSGGGVFPPIVNLTLAPPLQIVADPTLNFSLPAVYGSTSLTSGFVPDPFTVGVTAGGSASASYLGGGCNGYTTSAPSFSVNYTSGAFPTLRFYFIGGGDTTMIINSPSGSYYCVDDSFGTLNPTIDFNSPSSGRYDMWVATYAQGASVGGTLYVTENTGNHP